MRIKNKQVKNRKSKIKALFFVHKVKQKDIASELGVSVRTVKKIAFGGGIQGNTLLLVIQQIVQTLRKYL